MEVARIAVAKAVAVKVVAMLMDGFEGGMVRWGLVGDGGSGGFEVVVVEEERMAEGEKIVAMD